MRYVWTLVWSFLLSHMITYVVGSIKGAAYDFQTGNIIAAGFFILVSLIPLVMPKDEMPQEQ